MSDTTRPFHAPFAALQGLRDRLPASAQAPAEVSTPASPDRPDPVAAAGPRIARAVVRYERAGRGGKAVTVIEQLGLDVAARQVWLKDLKSVLGCGGAIEADSIVLQGDHRKRLSALLTARGVRKVTVS